MITIGWNGRKEHFKQQVNSAEYFNDHLSVIVHNIYIYQTIGFCIQSGLEVVYFGAFYGYRRKSIPTTPLKGLHKDSLNISEIFLYIKMENGLFRETPKIRDKKPAHVFHHKCGMYFSKK